jgi:hypothetical protein
MFSEVLSNIMLDTILPSVFSGFLLINYTLPQVSVLVLCIPYIALSAYLIRLYFLLIPSNKRLLNFKKRTQSLRINDRWEKYISSSDKKYTRKYLRNLDFSLRDAFFHLILRLSWGNTEIARERKRIAVWATMNMSLNLHGRIIISRDHVIIQEDVEVKLDDSYVSQEHGKNRFLDTEGYTQYTRWKQKAQREANLSKRKNLLL